MHFLKDKPEFYEQELRGNISNVLNFSIKDLYKKDAHRIVTDTDLDKCTACEGLLTARICQFCGFDSNE
jgi:hypothetical protein